MRRLALLLIALLSVGLAWQIGGQRISLPARWDPFAPLDVHAPLGPLTSWRLWRATRDPLACKTALDTAQMTYSIVPDQTAPADCPLHDIVRVARLDDSRLSSSFLATCPLALALAMYDRHYLQPAAQAIYGENVRQITHVGSYACRNVNHQAQAPVSEHALANALDIEGFVLTDGSRIDIAHDWSRDTRAGAFVKRARDGACAVFHTVLGPDYNALHRAHFHVDMGPYRVCS